MIKKPPAFILFMLITICSVILFSPPSNAIGGLWLQSIMYVKHYDDSSWDYVEGFNNQAVGIEYREGGNFYGVGTFINSYGDRTYGAHYSKPIIIGENFSAGFSGGLNHGYESEYVRPKVCDSTGKRDCKHTEHVSANIGGLISLSGGFFASFEYGNTEVSLITIGASAAAIKISFKVM